MDNVSITSINPVGVECTGLMSAVSSDITEKESDLDVTCYPIPLNDLLKVVFSGEITETVNVMLFNASGESLYSGNLNSGISHTVNMTGIPDGLYLIRITGTNINITKRIII